jgi:4-hydroxythreonine-4-phosphate dehydrogenase
MTMPSPSADPRSSLRPLALTLGDPAGIGGEIIARAFLRDPPATVGCFVAGDQAHLERALAVVLRRQGRRGAAAGPSDPSGVAGAGKRLLRVIPIGSPAEAAGVDPGGIPVLQVGPRHDPERLVAWGQVQAAAGRIAGEAVVWAARAALRGDIAGLVTAPLHKKALAAAGFPFPGHTELLQAEAAAHLQRPVSGVPVRMMLASDALRTVLVSIHVSLRQAIEAVTFDNVLQTLRITHQALTPVLGRPPRLAVAGLNPHAGEGGLFGREEIEIIAPAVHAARSEGIDADGPHPPDTVFMRARATRQRPGAFDAVIAMYHDQGLIPVKYLGLDRGVNVTLGLPLVRTSPDHGTAFDLAGTGRADPASLLAAIRAARQLAAPAPH